MKLEFEMNNKQSFARDVGSRKLDTWETEKQESNLVLRKCWWVGGVDAYVWGLHADVFLVVGFLLSFSNSAENDGNL